MKVLIISHYNPEVFEYGGLATFVKNLSKALKNAGHVVDYISVSPVVFRKYSNVKLVPSNLRPRDVDRVAHEVIRYCIELDGYYDVVIANDYFTPCVAYESKLITYVHNFIGSPWELIQLAYSDRVCTNSKMNKSAIEPHIRYVRHLTREWVGKDGNDEVYVAYQPPPEPPENIEVPQLDLEEPILCYVGRMQDYKNYPIFKKVVSVLGVNAVVISHDVKPDIESLSNSKIVYFSNVSDEVKWGLMRKCTLGIYPSLFDPYGLVPLEFVRSGVPVVVSRNCGVNEVLQPVTFDPNNLDELVGVVREVLKFRDEYLSELMGRPIMRKSWSDLVGELLSV